MVFERMSAETGDVELSLTCRIVGHRRNRRQVWYDGQNFRAPCGRCGVALIRELDGGWRPFDEGSDNPPGSPPRAPHHYHEA